MNLKSKLVGFGAATVLSLGMFTGIASADSANTTATASLNGKQCSISVSSSTLGFGTWEYNGTSYDAPTTGTDHNLSWDVQAGNPSGCDGSIEFDGLTSSNANVGGNPNLTNEIGLENFYGSLSFGGQSVQGGLDGTGLDTGLSASNLPTGTVSGYIQLSSVPDNAMPGWYQGTISTTVNNSQ